MIVVMLGTLATTACDYLAKGLLIFAKGRLQTRSWDDDKDSIGMVCWEVVLIGRGGRI
jgi:single-stranded DNA-binding protein